MNWRQAKKKRVVYKRDATLNSQEKDNAERSAKLLFQELEPRILYSADALGGVDALLDNDNALEMVVGQTTESAQERSANSSNENSDFSESELQSVREIIFIDSDTDNYQQFVDDIVTNSDPERHVEIVILDNNRDGIDQISETLAAFESIDAVHIFSHGQDGSIDLGVSRIDFDMLVARSAEISEWSSAFSGTADFLIYGCNLAASSEGQAFVDTLADITETDVAASDDLTGSLLVGGDWDLEIRTGEIEATIAISTDLQESYRHSLADITSNLEGHWTLDATGEDLSGNNYHGTLENGAAVDNTPGASVIGVGSVVLDGVNDHVNIDDHASNFGALSTGTISAWVKLSSTGIFFQGVFSLSDGATVNSNLAELSIAPGGSVNFWVAVDGISVLDVSFGASLDDDQWHHIAVVVDSSGNEFFVDGALIAVIDRAYNVGDEFSQEFFSTVNDGGDVSAMHIGSLSLGTGSEFFSGSIDDVRVYSRALANEDIQALAGSPDINNLSGDKLFYNPGEGAVVIEQGDDAFVTDNDSANFGGGDLEVAVKAGANPAEDILSVRNQGNGAGEIGFNGSDVSYEGVVIGTFIGGAGGTNLDINFNTNATDHAVTALLKNITYLNTNLANPAEGDRTIEFKLRDGDGNASSLQEAIVAIPSPNTAPVFGEGGGAVYTSVATLYDGATDMAIQPDGKYVVLSAANVASTGQDLEFALTRYNEDGSVDMVFGNNGTVITSLSTANEMVGGIALQANGKIVVSGSIASSGNQDAIVMRYNTDGILDSTFGASGVALVQFSASNDDTLTDIAVDDNDKIVVTGYSNNGTSDDVAVARLTSNGALDTTFNGNGKLTFSVGGGDDRANALALQAGGKIVLSGSYYNGGNTDVLVARLNDNGSFDPTFSGDGIQTIDFGATSWDSGNDVEIDSDGNIVLAGTISSGGLSDSLIMRLTDDASLDASFGSGGVTIVAAGSPYEALNEIALQDDGKIVVAGDAYNGSNNDISVIRLNANGSLDNTFDLDGKLTADLTGGTDSVNALEIDANGNIVIAGNAGNSIGDTFVARYATDGKLDSSFGAANTLDGTPTHTEGGAAVVLDADVVVSDLELDALNTAGNYAGATLTLARSGGPNGADILGFVNGNNINLSNENLLKSGSAIASFDTISVAGQILLTFTSANGQTPTSVDVDNILRQITYAYNGDNPPPTVQIDWTFSDGNSGSQVGGGALIATGSTTVTIVGVNDAPTDIVVDSESTAERTVNTYSTGDQIDPALAAFTNGGYVTVWVSDGQDGSNYGVFAQRFNADGSVNGAEFLVTSEVTDAETGPSVATFSDGGFVVAWQDQISGSGAWTEARVFNADGTAATAEFKVSLGSNGDNEGYQPVVVTLSNTEFAVVWANEVLGTIYEIVGQRFDRAGVSIGSQFTVGSLLSGSGLFGAQTEVTKLNDGGFAVIWRTHDGTDLGTRLRVMNADGSVRSSEVILNGDNIGDIATLTNGNIVVTYDTLGELNAAIYTSNGVLDTAAFTVNTTASAARYESSVTASGDGFVVAWESTSGDASGTSILAQRFDASGIKIGVEELVNETTTGNQKTPELIDIASGEVAAVWRSENVDGSGYAVVSRVIATGSATIAENVTNDTHVANVLRVVDADIGDTHTYSLSNDAGGRFAINAVTGEITVANASAIDFEANSSHNITIRAQDAAGDIYDEVLTITITDINEDPILTNIDGETVIYAEGDGAVLLDQGGDALVTEVDAAGLANGTLNVEIDFNGVPTEDVLSIRNQGNGAGEIGVNGNEVTYGGVVIGIFTGGATGVPLNVVFDTDATAAAVTALLRNLTYENTNLVSPNTGSRSIVIDVTDGDGGLGNANLSINVSQVNDAPINIVPLAPMTNEDTALAFTGPNQIQISDVDAAGAALRIQLNIGTGGLLSLGDTTGLTFTTGDGAADANMIFSGTLADVNAALLTLTYAPTADLTGNVNLTIVTNDQGNTGGDPGPSGTATSEEDTDIVVITLNSVNDAPVLTGGSASNLTVNEDSGFTSLGFGSLTYGVGGGADEAGQILSYLVTAIPDPVGFGKILLADGTTQVFAGVYTLAQIQGMQFRPEIDVNGGPSTFEFSVLDTGGTANGGADVRNEVIEIRITPDNDPAVVTGTFTGNVLEGNVGDAPVTATGTISISDPDLGDSPFFSDVPSTVGGYGSFELTSGTWTYTLDQSAAQALDAGELVTHTITFTASDGTKQQITIEITGTDDASAITGTFMGAVTEGNEGDAPVTATGTISISDVDGDDSPFFSDVPSTVGVNGYGSFELTSGTWTYTLDQSAVQALDAGDVVNDTITFIASDGRTQQITITITGADDASVVSGTVVGAVTEGNVGDAPVTATGSISVSDVDDDDSPAFNDVTTTGDSGFGSFTLTSGTWTYTLDQSAVQALDAGDVVNDTITFIASDGRTQQITITITGAADASVVTGTVVGAVTEGNVGDAAVTATGLISISDVDDDDSPIFSDVVATTGDNSYGSFELTSGTWTYTLDQSAVQALDAGDVVNDTITFTASDGRTQQITITITGADDASVVSGTVVGAVTEGNVGDAPVTATGSISVSDVDNDDSPVFNDVTTTGDSGFGSFTLTSGTWTYTLDQSAVQALDAGDVVNDTITFAATDGRTQQITITITGVDDASVVSGTVVGAVTEGNVGDAPVTATGSISVSDVDDDDSPVFNDVTTTGDSGFGSFTLTSGTWTYTLDQSAVQALDAGDVVNDTITFTAADGRTQQITITITGTDDASVVSGTVVGAVVEGNVGDAPVIATGSIAISDVDDDDSPGFADVVSTVGDNSYGSFVLTSGTWTYTLDQSTVQALDAGDVVDDTITFTASDGRTQQITITITGADDASVVTGTVVGAVTEGNVGDAAVTATGSVAINDVDDDDSPGFADVVSTVGSNGYGSFVLTSGTWTYTLDQNAVQALDAGDVVNDTITFTASDGRTQQITITITGTDDASVVSGTVVGAVTEGNVGDAPVTATGSISVSDVDDDDIPMFNDVTTTGDSGFGSFTLTSGTWTYTLDQSTVQALDAGDVVNDTITFTATDGRTQQITITITGTDDASVVSGTVVGAVVEGNVGDAPVTATGSIAISDVDDNDSPVFADVVSTVGNNGYGSFVLTSGTWTYTLDQSAVQALDAGDVVNDTITFTASDGTTQQITVTITGIDDTSAVTGTFVGAVTEGNVGDAPATATGVLSISDVDGDDSPTFADVVSTVGDNSYGSFVLTSGSWAYTLDQSAVQNLDAGDLVMDTITYTASDGSTQQITITISGADDTSVVTGTFVGAVTEGDVGDAPVTVTGSISISNADDDDNPVLGDVGPTVGDSGYGSFVLTSGIWTYTLDQSTVQDLDAGDIVNDTITFTASDGTTQQITVTITGANDTSVVTGTFVGAVTEGNVGDAPVSATGVLSISDVDGDDSPAFADVASAVGDNSYGSFVLTSGSWTYTLDQSAVQNLDAGDLVMDTITYRAADGSIDGATQQITVTITGTDDTSVVTGTVVGAVTEGNVGDAPVTATGSIAISDVDDNDSPVFADVVSTVGNNGYGSFVLTSGTWTYTLDQSAVQALDAGDVVNDTITFTASDGRTQQITITITGADDASVVSGTVVSAVTEGNVGDTPVTATGSISVSDIDDDDSPVFNDVVATAGDNSYGSFTLTSGTWTYTLDQSAVQNLDAGDIVSDTITFIANDDQTQRITITITGTADASMITGTVTGAVNEGDIGDAPVTAVGTLSIVDFDDDDTPFIADTNVTTAYGDFAITSGTWTYTVNESAVQRLDAGDVINDLVSIMASDGTTQGITITITGTDDASVVAGTFTGTTTEGNVGDAPVVASGSISISDVDQDDTPTFADVVSVGDKGYGTFQLTGNTWIYTLDQGAAQRFDAGDVVSDTVTVVASDGQSRKIEITIIGTADAPTTIGLAALNVNEDAPATTIDLRTIFDDIEDADAQLTYTVTSNTNASIFSKVDSAGGTLSLAYTPDASGNSDVTLRATDTNGGFVETTFSISVQPVNDAPSLLANTGAELDEDELVTLSAAMLRANDVDNTDADIIFALTGNPTSGTLRVGNTELGAGGRFTQADIDSGRVSYQASGDSNSVAGFSFRLTDRGGAGIAGTRDFVVSINETENTDENAAGGFAQEKTTEMKKPAMNPTSEPEGMTDQTPNSEIPQGAPPPLDPSVVLAFDEVVGEPLGDLPDVVTFETRFIDTNEDRADRYTDLVRNALKEIEIAVADVESELELDQDLNPERSEAVRDDRISRALEAALDTLSADLDESLANEESRAHFYKNAGHLSGVTLSAGFLAWLFRAGSLLASVLSVMPLWTRMDPLPILLAKKREDEAQLEADDEERAAAELLDGSTAAKTRDAQLG